MSEQETQPTEEKLKELEQKKEAYAEREIESLRFMRLYKDFKPDPANAQKMSDLLKAENLPWTAENLEKVYTANKTSFLTREVKQRPAPVEQEVVVPQPELPEWGVLTKQSLGAMDSATYQRFYNHKSEDMRVAFRQQVQNVLDGRNQFAGARQ